MKLFSGSASRELTEEVAKTLKLPLSLIDVHVFPDGERRIRIHDRVVGKKTVVIQSAPTPVDTNYMELFFIIDALRRFGADSITAVVPYFGYQRQDHVFRDGEAVSLEVMVRILQSLKVDRLISVDMHSVKIPDLFSLPVAHLSALPIFAKEIKKRKLHTPESVLISPDMGGVARVKKLSELLDGMQFAAVKKNRDLSTGSITVDGIKDGSIKGKKQAILVDDMISSGGTILKAAAYLKEQGMKDIYAFVTHPIFSEDGPAKLQKSCLKQVFVTDTVVVPKNKQFPKLTVLSVSEMLAKELVHPTASNNPLLSM